MAADNATGTLLVPVLTLLGAAVVAVPLFRKLGLGSVLGYFSAGLLVGPSGLTLFTHPETILHISELGVVMFLFIIGLEIRPQRLWALRREIFGLGLGQVLLCSALLTGATDEDTRRRDQERLMMQVTEGYMAGSALVHRNAPIPEPLTPPRRTSAVDGRQ